MFKMQTTFHRPPEEYGNCFRACVASLLEVSLYALPRFEVWMFNNPCTWMDIFSSWASSDSRVSRIDVSSRPLDCLHIVIGPSPRYRKVNHAVCREGRSLVHDPHPSGLGISDINVSLLLKQA
jgi:hypothetical protein